MQDPVPMKSYISKCLVMAFKPREGLIIIARVVNNFQEVRPRSIRKEYLFLLPELPTLCVHVKLRLALVLRIEAVIGGLARRFVV